MNTRIAVLGSLIVGVLGLWPAAAAGFEISDTQSIAEDAEEDFLNFRFRELPEATGPVTVQVAIRGDLDDPTRDFVLYSVDGEDQENICYKAEPPCAECGMDFERQSTTHPAEIVADGAVDVRIRKYFGVTDCQPTLEAEVTVRYPTTARGADTGVPVADTGREVGPTVDTGRPVGGGDTRGTIVPTPADTGSAGDGSSAIPSGSSDGSVRRGCSMSAASPGRSGPLVAALLLVAVAGRCRRCR